MAAFLIYGTKEKWSLNEKTIQSDHVYQNQIKVVLNKKKYIYTSIYIQNWIYLKIYLAFKLF